MLVFIFIIIILNFHGGIYSYPLIANHVRFREGLLGSNGWFSWNSFLRFRNHLYKMNFYKVVFMLGLGNLILWFV